MPDSVAKKGKRKTRTENPTAGFSGSLRVARDLVTSGKQSEGLTALNELAAATKNPARLGKILTIVGESQASLSRHTEACAAFAKAAQYANQAQEYDLLLRAGYGQVRSLLRSQRITEAKTAASQLIADLNTADQAIQAIANLSPAQLASQGNVTLPARPPRSTVVLTKIGNAFYESGLTDEAKAFYTQAIQISPNGASRARQNLAKLALASDNPALAERYARESLLMGRFQAKTVAAWQLYLDARARQNLVPILEPDVLGAFKTNAKDRIAGASLLSIVRVLRAHSDPTWKTVAQSAITSSDIDTIIATELEKLIQADAKLIASDEPRLIAARALKLFRATDVSSQEQVGHAKAYARYSLLSSSVPNLTLVNRIATERFGVLHTSAVRHAMALGAIQAKDNDRARIWLLDLLSDLNPGTEGWGKATWALARLSEDLGNPGEASVWYFELAENNLTPPRFRIQAMLKGFRQLAAAGGAVDTGKVSTTVSTLLRTVDDYKLALDAARQLSLAGASFLDLKLQAAQRGKSLATTALQNAASSREKLAIIEYVARRQAWDLGDFTSILEQWDQLPLKDRSEFETLSGSLWYEYVAILFKALTRKNRAPEAESLVASIIDRDRSTSEGYVIVGSEYAEWLLRGGQKAKAFEYFVWIAKESPTHRRAAVAHYWMALSHLKQGEQNQAKIAAEKVRACFGGIPALLDEWKMDAAAYIILNDNRIDDSIRASGVSYSKTFLFDSSARLTRDLAGI
ncbi:tetratricopeptide repeat protein [bacterium]|nr:tetratricopeptide repeat protein [bacterium]